MVKVLYCLAFYFVAIYGSDFDKNCFDCHGKDFKFHIIMNKYTLKYSSQERIKQAMFEYLKEPSYEKSILPLEYIEKFGLKEKTTLDDDSLRKMIDIYYDRYSFKSKLY